MHAIMQKFTLFYNPRYALRRLCGYQRVDTKSTRSKCKRNFIEMSALLYITCVLRLVELLGDRKESFCQSRIFRIQLWSHPRFVVRRLCHHHPHRPFPELSALLKAVPLSHVLQ